MSKFEDALSFVLEDEGVLSENPNDSGGITKYGISINFLKKITPENLKKYGIMQEVNEEVVRNLTMEQAVLIYHGEFWDKAPFEEIKSPQVGNYIFSMAVWHGLGNAIKIVQRAVWAALFEINVIEEDGIFGGKTLRYVNLVDFNFLYPLVAEHAAYVRNILEKNSKDGVFKNGWLSRCYRI